MNSFTELRFAREEIVVATYAMKITAVDAENLKKMDDDEIRIWITDHQPDYTERGNRILYDWHQGKEHPEGEGEGGMFGFSLVFFSEDGYGVEETVGGCVVTEMP